MIIASDFVKWLNVFDVPSNATGGGGPFLPLAGGTMLGDLILNASPSTGLQAATKSYVDLVIAGLAPAGPVTAATEGDFASTYDNGTAGVGATLTATATGTVTFDGQLTLVNEDYLIKNQTSTLENGIYICTVAGAIGVAAIFTRSDRYDTPTDINNTGIVPVINGTAQANTGWYETSTVVTIGTDPITFVKFGTEGTVTNIATGTGLTGGPITTSGTIDLEIPVVIANGGTERTSVPTGTSASQYAAWDANENIVTNTVQYNIQSFSSAGGTSQVMANDAGVIRVTGSSAEILQLPDITTISSGWTTWIFNASSGTTTVAAFDGSPLVTLTENQCAFAVRKAGATEGVTPWDVAITVFDAGFTGTGNMVLSDDPTFTDRINTPTIYVTGGAMTNIERTVTAGAAVTVSPDDGWFHTVTLTEDCVINLGGDPGAGESSEVVIRLLQNATGNWNVTWTGIAWATNSYVAPPISLVPGTSTYIVVRGISVQWVGYPAPQEIGIIAGEVADAGYIGETISSAVLFDNRVGALTGTTRTITSIVLTPGSWRITGRVGLFHNGGGLITQVQGGVDTSEAGDVDDDNPSYVASNAELALSVVTNSFPVVTTLVNITSDTTYYLRVAAVFSSGTTGAIGNIDAERTR